MGYGKSVGMKALEATKIVVKEEVHLQRLYLPAYTKNIVTIRVYQKAGFKIFNEHIADNGINEYTMSV